MLARSLTTKADLKAALEVMLPDLIRYPALDAASFERRVGEFLENADDS